MNVSPGGGPGSATMERRAWPALRARRCPVAAEEKLGGGDDEEKPIEGPEELLEGYDELEEISWDELMTHNSVDDLW
eukprot:SAG22_NODE_321_length_12398_cov_3.218392_2_plen_77_part_00